jgi:GT2 family glycosyltransferase
MQGISIIIPVFNKLEITQQCIKQIREFNSTCAFEIIVVDNGSTDSTPETLSLDKDITYIRNQENLGISKAYNLGSSSAQYPVLCFMHNDVFVLEEKWILKMSDFILHTLDAGIVGLYGAKTLRKNGSFRGKTIVHSQRGSASMKRNYEKVAVVDGLLLAMSKLVFQRIRGFNDIFSVHFYDKDISMRSIKNELVNYVLCIPFEHLGTTTRKAIKEDNRIRHEAQNTFIRTWEKFLPVDVSTWREKLSYIFQK